MKPMPQIIEVKIEIDGIEGSDPHEVADKANALLDKLINRDNFGYFVDIQGEMTMGDYPRWLVTATPAAKSSAVADGLLE